MNLLPALFAAAEASKFGPRPGPSILDYLGSGLIGLGLICIVLMAVIRTPGAFSGSQTSKPSAAMPGELSAGYRRKVVNWLTSMFLLVTFATIGFCFVWFDTFFMAMATGDPDRWIEQVAGPLSDAFSLCLLVFPAIFGWHLGDFLELRAPRHTWIARLTSYRLLACVVVLLGILDVMRNTGWFTVVGSCGGAFMIMNQACAWTQPAISLPTTLLLPLIWLLGLLKLAVMLWTRLGPRA